MNKEKKKKPKYNHTVIAVLEGLYALSNYYIRQCISGSKQGITPDKIRKDYKKLEDQINKASSEVIQEFTNQ